MFVKISYDALTFSIIDAKDVKNLLDSISGLGLSEDTNKVIVEIRELDDEKIQIFQFLISDSEMVDFKVGGYFSY